MKPSRLKVEQCEGKVEQKKLKPRKFCSKTKFTAKNPDVPNSFLDFSSDYLESGLLSDFTKIPQSTKFPIFTEFFVLLVGLMGFLDFWFLDIGTQSFSKSSENWEIPSNDDRFWSFLTRIIVWKIRKNTSLMGKVCG